MEKFNIERYLSRDEYNKVLNFINKISKNKSPKIKSTDKLNSINNNIIDIDEKINIFNKKWPFDNIQISKPSEYMIATQSAKYILSHTIHLDNMIKIFKNIMDNDKSYFIRGIIYKNFNYGEINKKINAKNKVKKIKKDENTKDDILHIMVNNFKKNDNINEDNERYEIIEQKMVKNKSSKSRKNKMFDNQATLIVWSELSNKNINLKLFINGSGSMTGCRHINDSNFILNKLIDEINKYKESMVIKNTDIINDDKILKLISCNITMMKSDFELKMCIDRTSLRNILLEKYKILTIYDPTIYPGVKICYMWNQENKYNDGVCHCSIKCKPRTKKKSGIGDCECITVTIIVFEKGKVVITGARNKTHTDDAYHFINKIIDSHSQEIVVTNIINM